MPQAIVYIGYIAMVVVIVALSIKLGKYVDIIDAKSNISGAFIGGVMLAAVTSLPELFTSLSAVWIVRENSMIIGNILGSDLINLAFFGVILLIFGRGLKKATFSKFYYVALGVALGMYALVAIGLYFAEYMRVTWFSAVSPAVLVLYVLFVSKMPKTSEASDQKATEDGITLKQAVVRFLICAVVLIGASIAMTYLTDMVADKLNLGKTFAGALFLGVATSLPELISSATLCFRGNYDAAAGNIIGSNVFNFAILFVADALSFMPDRSEIYILNSDSKWLLIFGVIATASTLCMMIIKNKCKPSRGALIGVQAINAVPPVIYVLYLLITTAVIAV